jgi:hypothetical protein
LKTATDERYRQHLLAAHVRIDQLKTREAELESMLHEISASLVDGPDIGPELPRAVKAELGDMGECIENLEGKLNEAADAWYFPSQDMTERSVGRLVCMCGTRAEFVEPSSRMEQRSVNCECGRRWLWRWTDQRDEQGGEGVSDGQD